MKLEAEYKTIYFLSVVIVLTTIIGEFYRIENIKEGFNFGKIIKMIKAVGAFFGMIVSIIEWLFKFSFVWVPLFFICLAQYAICAIQMVFNIPNCFLWYSLQIAGKIIYLPFSLTFFFLDLIFSAMKIPFSIEKTVDKVWWFLDDIDHFLYDNGSGFHFLHYPDEIIKRCYSCNTGKYPKLPKLRMRYITIFMRNIK
jgi:hypothetical protein